MFPILTYASKTLAHDPSLKVRAFGLNNHLSNLKKIVSIILLVLSLSMISSSTQVIVVKNMERKMLIWKLQLFTSNFKGWNLTFWKKIFKRSWVTLSLSFHPLRLSCNHLLKYLLLQLFSNFGALCNIGAIVQGRGTYWNDLTNVLTS